MGEYIEPRPSTDEISAQEYLFYRNNMKHAQYSEIIDFLHSKGLTD
jgi:hypothetical protein